ncbi:MAG TPA: hypothetical protein VHE14_08585, partial [Solirubrobacteraceae bacterium]|nr:hypothetical protein [Solirubrobacteraceae bacterium]
TGFDHHDSVGVSQPSFDKVPPRIDWTSVNPHAQCDNHPRLEAVQRIYQPTADHQIVRGRIEQRKGGHLRFRGTFQIDNSIKTAAELTDSDKQQLVADFNAKQAGAHSLATACPALDPSQPSPNTPPPAALRR